MKQIILLLVDNIILLVKEFLVKLKLKKVTKEIEEIKEEIKHEDKKTEYSYDDFIKHYNEYKRSKKP